MNNSTFNTKLRLILCAILLFTGQIVWAQTIMFDDFNYSGTNDAALSSFNKWRIINGISGPPSGGQYTSNNINFIADPANSQNKLMTLSTTVNGQSRAITHSRIETEGFEYFEGTYSSRVYFTDLPYQYKDANIQTFFTIVSSSLGTDGSRYSELDFEYMAADKWGISTDDQVMYLTSWNRYIADPWQAWKRYFSYTQSYEGWHIFTVSCTDGVNVKYWIDDQYMGSMATTDNDGTSVYPRNPMQIAFANWVWNNVIGSSTANRTTTMDVDWVLFYKNLELNPTQVASLVNDYRSQGIQRRNIRGDVFSVDPNAAPSVVITSPSNNSEYGAPATINITANASDTDGSINQVAFYNGGQLISTDNTAPYTANLSNLSAGTYSLTAKATDNDGATTTSSIVSVTVKSSTNGSNIAIGKPTYASSTETADFPASYATDGNSTTRWASTYSDPQWIYVNLEDTYNIEGITLKWEAAYGSAYQIQVASSANGPWTTIYQTSAGNGNEDVITNLSGAGQFVRLYGTARGSEWGYSLYELEVYGNKNTPNPPTASEIFIEAEDYTNMGGIQVENCSEGGQNIGYVEATDWLSYANITFPSSGTYNVEYRVASESGNAQLSLDLDAGSISLGTVNVPATGGWQVWQTVTNQITVEAGTYSLGVYASTGGWNLNWLRFTKANNLTSKVNMNGSEAEISIYPNPVHNLLKINAEKEIKSISIFTLTGIRVKEFKNTGSAASVDVSNLKPGIYIIKMEGTSTTIAKFMKE